MLLLIIRGNFEKKIEEVFANLTKPFNCIPTVYLLYTPLWLERPKHIHKQLRNKPFKTVTQIERLEPYVRAMHR